MTAESGEGASAPRPSVFTLVYLSTARRLVLPHEMEGLLRASRERNAAAGITGALLYSGGTFMQALEGDEPAVRALFGRICEDARHVAPTVMVEETSAERQFGSWWMSYGGAIGEASGGTYVGGREWGSSGDHGRRGRSGRACTLIRSFGRTHGVSWPSRV